MQILVVNSGSSSMKLRVISDDDSLVASSDLPADAGDSGLDAFLTEQAGIDIAAHRIVHGGPLLTEPVWLDPETVHQLEALRDLAPLHNARALAAIQQVRRLRPALRQAGCFDTSFHAGMPAEAAAYALPREWTSRWKIRRYGFHGLSHAYASRRAAEVLDRPLRDLRIVSAHLGSGASLAAVDGGRSVDTTMGFTPLEGLVMATRSGTIDPGLVLWLQTRGALNADEIEDGLEHRSGLFGLSGRSADLRQVLAGADEGDTQCRLAYAAYLHRLRALIASMAASMNGMDALLFTAGIGEHSSRVRGDTCTGLSFLGVSIDDARNSAGGPPDRVISAAGSKVAVLVIAAREDLEIARQVRQLVGR